MNSTENLLIRSARVSNPAEATREPFDFALIRGTYSREDALELVTKMVDVKIKYHEKQIDKAQSEEDVKMRESRIKQLQKKLAEFRQYLQTASDDVSLSAQLEGLA